MQRSFELIQKAKSIRQNLILQQLRAAHNTCDIFPIPQVTSGGGEILVVGSGASVLDFDLKSSVSGSFSIAINDAIFLDDGFSVHSFELSNHEPWRPHIRTRVSRLLSSSSLEVLCHSQGFGHPNKVPDFMKQHPNRVHLWTTVNAEKEKLEQQLRYYLSPKNRFDSPGPDPNFSLGRLIVRLMKLGYTDIRLAGVDLVTPDYFWNRSKEFSWMREIQQTYLPMQGLQSHRTARSTNPWPAKEFLLRLKSFGESHSIRIAAHRMSPASRFLDSWD